MLRSLGQNLYLCLIGFAFACNTYQPVETFESLSAEQAPQTGKRWVSPFFLTPGQSPDLETTKDLGAKSSVKDTESSAYQPKAVDLVFVPSEDKSYKRVIDLDVAIGDGTRLKTDIYAPMKPGKYPVIIERTPIDRKDSRFVEKLGPLFAKQGFVFVVQNVRGLFGSEGEFSPFLNEGKDGGDMHKWIAKQTWFKDAIGAMGSGYGAFAACLGAQNAPHLKAMILENCPSDLFLNGGLFFDGVPMTSFIFMEAAWRLMEYPSLIESLRWDDALFHLPLNEMDNILGQPLPFWDECLRHPSYTEFWRQFSLADRFNSLDCATLHISGWCNQQDLGGGMTVFEAMLEQDQLRGRSGRQAMVMGPWSMGVNSETYLGYYDFTQASVIDESSLYSGWFHKWLKGDPKGQAAPKKPIKLFVMGANEWREFDQWPLKDVTYEPFFIHSDGDAQKSWLPGLLDGDPPGGFEEIDSFTSDPLNPVMAELELGTDDQRPVEQREDVLCYTSAPLEEDLLVVGSPQAILYANTLAEDSDLFVMLTDVDEFGFSRPVSFGVIRTRFRDSFREPTPVSGDEINTYIIDLIPCANKFLKGHSIRMDIMGSYFPFITRNMNTGSDIGTDTLAEKATVFILHDFDYPSRVMLPVLME